MRGKVAKALRRAAERDLGVTRGGAKEARATPRLYVRHTIRGYVVLAPAILRAAYRRYKRRYANVKRREDSRGSFTG